MEARPPICILEQLVIDRDFLMPDKIICHMSETHLCAGSLDHHLDRPDLPALKQVLYQLFLCLFF